MITKRKKVTTIIIIALACLFIVSLFFPIERSFMNALPHRKASEAFRDYRLIKDNQTFKVTVVNSVFRDKDAWWTYLNKDEKHLFCLKRDEPRGINETLYSMDSNENPTEFQLPKDAHANENGYITDGSLYCNWFENGDTAFYPSKPIKGILTIDEFQKYYQAADFSTY